MVHCEHKIETQTQSWKQNMNFQGSKKLTNVKPNRPFRVDSLALLVKAQNGEIPLASLHKFDLDQNEVAIFLARELLFLHSAAECAKMNSLAILFYELHTSLIDVAKITGFFNNSKNKMCAVES
jgi:hypothetical protein